MIQKWFEHAVNQHTDKIEYICDYLVYCSQSLYPLVQVWGWNLSGGLWIQFEDITGCWEGADCSDWGSSLSSDHDGHSSGGITSCEIGDSSNIQIWMWFTLHFCILPSVNFTMYVNGS